MKVSSTKNFFVPRARLLLQLGDKLIKNENIAILELVKNSYDADARNVTVRLQRVDDTKTGVIEILDDGEGMDMQIIEDVWLQPGSDHKENLFKQRKRSDKYDRLPIGEKGIGRFGVHKLGNKIELISRRENSNEVVVKIDWEEFAKKKFLKDAKIEVFERTPEYFLRKRTGTRIIIDDLKSSWDPKMIRDLYKSLFTLNSPFKKPGKFEVHFEIDDESIVKDLPEWSDIQDLSLWHFKCTLENSEITAFNYEFTPWVKMQNDGIGPQEFDLNNSEYLKNRSTLSFPRKKEKSEDIIDLSRNYGTENEPRSIGKVEMEGYIFDRASSVFRLANVRSKKLIKDYLDEQGGFRLYRDNIRINEYGEPGNDWLNLDIRRVNVPTKRISNNIVLGVIELEPESSNALIEKTNREGLIENDAFHDFASAILYVISLVENLRNEDKDKIRNKYDPKKSEEPVLYQISELKSLVSKEIENEKLRNKINEHLDKIEKDYAEINEILLTSAGAGLTLAVGVHEIEKVVAELKKIVLEDSSISDGIQRLISHLDDLISNYGDLLRQSDIKEFDPVDLINGALFNTEYRLKSHDIELIPNYKNYKESVKVNCAKRLILGSIVNIIDNSIYWLDRKQKNLKKLDTSFDKKILIDLHNDSVNNIISIIIADNGLGFGLPTDQLIKPFISDKPNGMGLGLHIVNEVMKVQGGSIMFPHTQDYNIPKEFESGAVIGLQLKY